MTAKERTQETISALKKYSLADWAAFLSGVVLLFIGLKNMILEDGYKNVWFQILLIAVGNVQLYAPFVLIDLLKKRLGIKNDQNSKDDIEAH